MIVIINEEAYVSQWVVDNGYGMRNPYSDSNALSQIIFSLSERRKCLLEFVECARKAFDEKYTWVSLEPKLKKLFLGNT